jgi:ParB family chromosome partitioning protein
MKNKSSYRADVVELVEKVENEKAPVGLIKIEKNEDTPDSREKVALKYDLGKTTVARYLRVNKLTDELKSRLDNDDIAIRTAVSLSYLRKNEQKAIESLIKENRTVNMLQAEQLRKASVKGELSKPDIAKFLEPTREPPKVKSRTFSSKFLSRYFNETHSTEDIDKIVGEALKQYFANQES